MCSKRWIQLSLFFFPKMLIIPVEKIYEITYISLNYENDHLQLFGGQIWNKTEFSFFFYNLNPILRNTCQHFKWKGEINWISSKNSTVKSRKWMIIPVFSLWWFFFLDLHLQGKSIKDFREHLFYYQYYCEDVSNITFSMSVGGLKFLLNL